MKTLCAVNLLLPKGEGRCNQSHAFPKCYSYKCKVVLFDLSSSVVEVTDTNVFPVYVNAQLWRVWVVWQEATQHLFQVWLLRLDFDLWPELWRLLVGVCLQTPTFVKRSSLPFSGNRSLFQSYWHLDGRCHHVVALISSSLICSLFTQSTPFFTNTSTASHAIEQHILFFLKFWTLRC